MRIWLFCLAICLLGVMSVFGHAWAEERNETFRAVIDADGIQRIRIVGGSYFFKPDHIIVRVGVPVEVYANLEPGIVPHTLVIDAAKAGIAIDATLGAEIKTFTFTPTIVGKYPFYCKNKLLFFESHREKGMAGLLEVIE